mmetsp:Transcript_13714/g.29477  ORF Transcript_13714/g.29477 Transcript_13714/m.29477 type:complete len:285 (+) Transcript_13714:122-976(+)|eukprot:CAMPEP_0202890542 /NCGR_PEP_ID=MMETSP1392-20130828/907_1 /ASSEMBLY_ACC=CAM_ASM_000868 /TAXON_ID=225041 /ORGANISM="Chlamydomonas chlamydogama, Strain SAG 11-48b" /LENGTH=284 /DNA_ID=CAMNT_0049574129 /DNA_START=79 /DNA_END=933 /DNA_ORIENTATION=+
MSSENRVAKRKKNEEADEAAAQNDRQDGDAGDTSNDDTDIKASAGPSSTDTERMERLLRKAETILRHRTDRILLVLERPLVQDNFLGCLRTAECMGIQNVWIVVQQRGYKKEEPPAVESRQEFKRRLRLSRQSEQWLDVREFKSTAECIAELQRGGWEVWSTDLSESAVDICATELRVPDKLAIVMGREADGVTAEMLAASHKRVYLPLVGFNTSLNLQVATGMVLQRILGLAPEARGQMSEERRAEVRKKWYTKLARSEAQQAAFMSRLDSPPPPFDDIRTMQ